jgi:hypothetical protein
MRGVELPISTMIVIIICLVILVVAVMFVMGLVPPLRAETVAGYMASCCRSYVLVGGCEKHTNIDCIVSTDIDPAGKIKIEKLAEKAGYGKGKDAVKRACCRS